jgi:hypothetical protein
MIFQRYGQIWHSTPIFSWNKISFVILKGSNDGALHSVLLFSGLDPLFNTLKRDHYVSGAGSAPIFRWKCLMQGLVLSPSIGPNRTGNITVYFKVISTHSSVHHNIQWILKTRTEENHKEFWTTSSSWDCSPKHKPRALLLGFKPSGWNSCCKF